MTRLSAIPSLLITLFIPVLLSAQMEPATVFLPNIISTDLNERDLAISPGGDTIIYTVGTHDNTHRGLFLVTRIDQNWSEKQLLPFSGQYQDIEPFFAPDGQRLLFASTRPIFGDTTRSDYNLWYVDCSNNQWGQPVPFDSSINSTLHEYYPSMSENQNLYFTTSLEEGIGLEDIWMSEWNGGMYKKPTVLDSNINTKRYEFNAFISPDENTLIFSSFGREDGQGGGDLYLSRRNKDGNWDKATNMGPTINSTSLDYCPFYDVKNMKLYFTSNRTSGSSEKMTSYDDIKSYDKAILNGYGNIYVKTISINH